MLAWLSAIVCHSRQSSAAIQAQNLQELVSLAGSAPLPQVTAGTAAAKSDIPKLAVMEVTRLLACAPASQHSFDKWWPHVEAGRLNMHIFAEDTAVQWRELDTCYKSDDVPVTEAALLSSIFLLLKLINLTAGRTQRSHCTLWLLLHYFIASIPHNLMNAKDATLLVTIDTMPADETSSQHLRQLVAAIVRLVLLEIRSSLTAKRTSIKSCCFVLKHILEPIVWRPLAAVAKAEVLKSGKAAPATYCWPAQLTV